MSVEFAAELRLGGFEYRAALQASNEIVVLFGHSGAGKSVTLQVVAGLLRPDSGRIVIDGTPVFDSFLGINRPPQERGVGLVVQDLALFPHMNVAQNIAFGMARERRANGRVGELLRLLNLAGFENRKPRSLSGGQQQRVALARALARDSRVLLLDEPFSALDESLRAGLRKELLRLRAELGLTILFVTHDLREAHLLADRIAVFDEGTLLQFGPRDEVFRRPHTRRVAELVGVTNIWPGTVSSVSHGAVRVEAAGLEFDCALAPNAPSFVAGQPVHVMVRAERVNLRRGPGEGPPGRTLVEALLTEEFAFGSTHQLHFAPIPAGPPIEAEIAARPYEVLDVASRKQWTLEIRAEDLHVAPATES